MWDLGEQAILVEIKADSQKGYWLGDQHFPTLPQTFLKRLEPTANWNRALRYLVIDDQKATRQGWIRFSFHLYLEEQMVKVHGHDGFEQQILDQPTFQKFFLPQIMAFRQRNLHHYQLKKQISYPLAQMQVKNDRDFHHYWVSETWELPANARFKVLFRSGSQFNVFCTSLNQWIYQLDFSWGTLDLVDVKQSLGYDYGLYEFNVPLKLSLMVEIKTLTHLFLTQLAQAIRASEQLDSLLKPWHLWNSVQQSDLLEAQITLWCQTLTWENFHQNLAMIAKKMKFDVWKCFEELKELRLLITNTYPEVREKQPNF